MPAFNIPAQTPAPRPGTAVPGRDMARDRGGADFGRWMPQPAAGNKQESPAAKGEAADSGQDGNDSSVRELSAPSTSDLDASTADIPQESVPLDDETGVFLAAMNIADSPPPPGPMRLPPPAAPTAPAELPVVSVMATTEVDSNPASDSNSILTPASLDGTDPGTDQLNLVEAGATPPERTKTRQEIAAPALRNPSGDEAAEAASIPITPRDTSPTAPLALPDSGAVGTTPAGREPSPATDQSGLPRLPHPELHRQIADAIVRSSPGQIEVLLDPVELGRVTVLLGEDGNPGRLALLVERPETLELIRRHSDQLLRDLRENGMPDAQLEDLRQETGSRRDSLPQGSGGPNSADDPANAPPTLPPEAPARPVILGRLDIRF